jgi:hypothetical protein
MTDEDANKLLEDMKETYGDKLANPDVFPKIFEHQVKLYKYYKRTVNESNESSDSSGPRH